MHGDFESDSLGHPVDVAHGFKAVQVAQQVAIAHAEQVAHVHAAFQGADGVANATPDQISHAPAVQVAVQVAHPQTDAVAELLADSAPFQVADAVAQDLASVAKPVALTQRVALAPPEQEPVALAVQVADSSPDQIAVHGSDVGQTFKVADVQALVQPVAYTDKRAFQGSEHEPAVEGAHAPSQR